MRYLIFALFQFLSMALMAQQRAIYSQYMFNGLAVNPAYSAMDEALSITGLARQQWVGFKGAPNTQTLSAHTPIKESNTSAGLLLVRDQIGEVISENDFFLTLAQRVQIAEDTYLAVGVDAGLSKNLSSYSDIADPNSVNDPVFTNQNELQGNFGFGIMLFSDKFYTGFSSPYFYTTNFGNMQPAAATKYQAHYVLQGGYLADLGEDFKFKPNAMVKYVKGSPVQIDLNANLLIKDTFWIGGSWRSFDSFDVIAELYITPQFQLGYSYDFTTTELSTVQRGSHEIMLKFRVPVKGRDFPKCYF